MGPITIPFETVSTFLMGENVQVYWVPLALAVVHSMFWKCNNTLHERCTEEEEGQGERLEAAGSAVSFHQLFLPKLT